MCLAQIHTASLSLALLLTIFTPLVVGSMEIDLFRLLQFNKNSESFGSQLASLNFLVAHFKGDVQRKVGVIHLKDITESILSDLISKKPTGLIIIIGQKLAISSKLWSDIQKFFIERPIPIPIYFARESRSLLNWYDELLNQAPEEGKSAGFFDSFAQIFSESEGSQIVLNIDEPSPLKTLNLMTYYSLLSGEKEEEYQSRDSSRPILAILGYYDSYSISPDLPSGLDTNGSGMLALLELARIFERLYLEFGYFAEYELLFILTPTGTLNFDTTLNLQNLPADIFGRIQFGLCLDTIGSGNRLNLHISRVPKENEKELLGQKMFKGLNMTSKQMEIELDLQIKKINLGTEFVPWQHQQLAKNTVSRIHGVTLSAVKTIPESIYEKTSMFDTKESLEVPTLEKNIRFIAESLMKVIFGMNQTDFSVFTENTELVNKFYINQMLDFFSHTSRFPSNLVKGTPNLKEIEKVFEDSLPDMQRMEYIYDKMEFFTHKPAHAKIYKVKSRIIDLYLFVMVMCYLGILYFVLSGPAQVIQRFKSNKQTDEKLTN